MPTYQGTRATRLGAKARGQRRQRIRFDPVLWGIPVFLTLLAGVLIASTQRQSPLADWENHWITAVVAIGAAVGLSRVALKHLQQLLLPVYIATLVSLLAVKLVGTSALGAQRWISIGGFNIQPSEFAKLAAILLLAGILAKHPIERPVDLLRPMAVISVPWAMVFIQPDLGTSLVFGAVLLAMLYWAGLPLEWLVLLISPLPTALIAGLFPWGLIPWGALLVLLAWRSLPWKAIAVVATLAINGIFAWITPLLWEHGLKDYQRDRLILFLDPTKDPLGGGYHLLQSTVGIGSGQIFGTGLMQGQLTKLQFIPEQHTDFIFSALGEEAGFIGCLVVLVAYLVWAWRLLQIAGQARSDFESLVVIGVLAMVMFQVVININMTIGLGPVTGIPLPWLSYGRFALLVNFMGIGLVASVEREARRARMRLQ
ncbi:MAG TPA: rod shape-determining protein RodA [Synechococcales bacterium UBA12195]|nr:rod shape-determining protein RodA [Synechococcales bacterium UBA12195]|tara:strand:+ start:5353 stop:6633 length:1281 start_codon:yes stop_codon:yes gene_type:complete